MSSAVEDLARLREALSDGRLAEVCREHGLALCVLHGSALTEDEPGDIDLAVAWAEPGGHDLVALIGSLMDVVGDSVDVMDLHRAGPVAAQRALTRGELLVQVVPGSYATWQMRAMRDFMDTQRFRDLQLEVYAQ